MSLLRIIDSPFSWALAGFAIGLGLGVNSASAWLVAAGLGGFIVYLRFHGQAHQSTEGRLFAAGPAFIMGWLVGFVVHGLAF
jgi:hypothetical protein